MSEVPFLESISRQEVLQASESFGLARKLKMTRRAKTSSFSKTPADSGNMTRRAKTSSSSTTPAEGGNNRPRNHLITDATKPFTFSFLHYGVKKSITVNQTPDEETWPGGALWDLGVLLAQFLVHNTRGASLESKREPPKRLRGALSDFAWKDIRVLELGCGVGLTGLVAATLGAKVTLLTDLDVVVDRVASPNVQQNTNPGPNKSCGYRLTKAGGRVAAVPLCWGSSQDEQEAAATMEHLSKATNKTKRPKGAAVEDKKTAREGIPDLIIIGDVAYQHKPGAPSHFDALLSTLLKFLDEKTLVLFGTRMRMPASADLLAMFHEHMDETLYPPLEADELDPAFRSESLGRKHNMTLHLLRKKKSVP